ncbi:MAG TPA: hypothetical protein VFA05_04030 [Gaiellaceae bacterium]|nr:hypothetical protein [Gaiellaceae bacterium]
MRALLESLRPAAPLRWARPRRELALLALCAVAALSVVNNIDVQDQSRWCLTDAVLHGRLTVDRCISFSGDRSRYGGHLYSNKAPGMSLLALPAVAALDYSPSTVLHTQVGAKMWLVRLFACGLPFLLAAFLVGRVCESLRPGTGGPALVTFALATPVAPFAAAGFDHVPTAAFAFAAFVLAWRRRPFAAGVAAGAAVLGEYEAVVVVLCLGLYALLGGRRALLRYVLGVLPGAAALGAYDWAAFGRPWRTPLPYSDNEYRAVHRSGLLGVHLPNLHSVELVFTGPGGLVTVSPVLALAAYGLVRLWRRGLRAEAGVCAVVAAAFVVAECGYGDPYGGYSPVPRYLIPAIPFLAVGLAEAFARLRAATALAAAVSLVATTALTISWSVYVADGGAWNDVARFASDAQEWLSAYPSPNALAWLGLAQPVAAIAAMLAGAAAFVFSLDLGARGAAPRAVPA